MFTPLVLLATEPVAPCVTGKVTHNSVPLLATALLGLLAVLGSNSSAVATSPNDALLLSVAPADTAQPAHAHRLHPLHAQATARTGDRAQGAAMPVADTDHYWQFDTRLEHGIDVGGFTHIVVDGEPAVAQSKPAPTVAADDFIVMIDPGHGGTDPGAEAYNGLLEKELTRDIAERTQQFLSEIDGVSVLLTRDGDEGLSRQHRVDRIRDSGADMVLSLHFNHLPQQDVTLVESFYAGAANIAESLSVQRDQGLISVSAMTGVDTTFTEGSARLARLVQRRVFGEVNQLNPLATDAGVKRDTLFVLTRSFVPGALIELTCLSNPGEAERLASPLYRARLAAALADAVRDYRRSLADRPLGEMDA